MSTGNRRSTIAAALKKHDAQKRKGGLPEVKQPRQETTGGVPVSPGKNILRTLFSIDRRSLALFRIVMGLLLLADLAIRATDLRAMYTDEGMFPRGEISYRVTTIWNWSLHFGSGTSAGQAVLFGIGALFGVALLAGFETRLVTVGSWLLLVSLHHRVPPILSGADILLRMLLFWGMFLPLGKAWSIDRFRERRASPQRGEPTPVLSIATAAILLQMAIMYLSSAIFKSNTEWFQGDVIKRSLEHDFYAKPLAAYLLQFPTLLTGMTWATFVLEWIGPLLLFIPRRTAAFRLAAVAALAAMHTGIALFLDVDLFSPVAMAGLTLFLPTEFWESKIFRGSRQPSAESSPAQPFVPTTRPSFLIPQAICAVALIYVFVVNLQALQTRAGMQPQPVSPGFLRTACGLGQKWNMFDEAPSRDGWYVARATLHDGSQVDLLRKGQAIVWTRPPVPAAIYPNFRWRKLFREMAYDDVFGFQVFREPVARFLYREWNARHPAEKQIAQFDLIFCTERESGAIQGSSVKVTDRENLLRVDLRDS